MLSAKAGGIQEAHMVERTQNAVELAINENNPKLWQPGMEEATEAEVYKVAQVSPCSIKPAQTCPPAMPACLPVVQNS